MSALRQQIGQVALAAILVLVTVFSTGEITVRLMEGAADDNLTAYAHYFGDPQQYEGDVFAQYAQTYVWSTVMNTVPALAWKHAGIDPVVFLWLFVLAQNALTAWAVARFSRTVTNEPGAAWASALFFVAANPIIWNLAYYPGIVFFPYAGQLVLPFVVFAAAEVVSERPRRAIGWLFAAGLIHPSITAYMVVIAAGYWLVTFRARPRRELVTLAAGLAVVVATTFVPRLLFARPDAGAQVTSTEVMHVLHGNNHVTFLLQPGLWHFSMPAFIGFACLTLLAFNWRERFERPATIFFGCVTAAAVLFGVLHFLALREGVVPVILLVGPRLTQLAVLLAVPFVVSDLLHRIRRRSWLQSWTSVAILLTACLFMQVTSWLLIAALFWADLADGRLLGRRLEMTNWPASVFCRLAAVLAAGAWVGVIVMKTIDPAYELSILGLTQYVRHLAINLSQQDAQIRLQVVIAFSAVLATVTALIRRFASDSTAPRFGWTMWPTAGMVTALLAVAFFKGMSAGGQTTQPQNLYYCLKDAQLWAKTHTPDSAVFVVTDYSWRSLSERRVVAPAVSGMFIYNQSRPILRHNEDIIAYFWPESAPTHLGWQQLAAEIRAKFDALDEAGLKQFAQHFGATHLVRASHLPPLEFENIYSNSHFSIYAIPAGAHVASRESDYSH